MSDFLYCWRESLGNLSGGIQRVQCDLRSLKLKSESGEENGDVQ
jgi:hypothetical protein